MNNDITFNRVISDQSVYGIIWSGRYKKESCVIKMVSLTSGVHYDLEKKVYRDGQDNKLRDVPLIYMNHRSETLRVPFLHHLFRERASMTRENFFDECQKMTKMSDLGLAPKVYGYGVCDQLYPIHYGFLIMERMDSSVKDVILKRDLTKDDLKVIFKVIDRMHNKCGIVHGDMKPSNIGVNLDREGRIIKCLLFDCQKVKFKTNLTESKFAKRVKRDHSTFHSHVASNTQQRQQQRSNLTRS